MIILRWGTQQVFIKNLTIGLVGTAVMQCSYSVWLRPELLECNSSCLRLCGCWDGNKHNSFLVIYIMVQKFGQHGLLPFSCNLVFKFLMSISCTCRRMKSWTLGTAAHGTMTMCWSDSSLPSSQPLTPGLAAPTSTRHRTLISQPQGRRCHHPRRCPVMCPQHPSWC